MSQWAYVVDDADMASDGADSVTGPERAGSAAAVRPVGAQHASGRETAPGRIADDASGHPAPITMASRDLTGRTPEGDSSHVAESRFGTTMHPESSAGLRDAETRDSVRDRDLRGRPGPSAAPGTAFSRVSHLWRTREALSHRRVAKPIRSPSGQRAEITRLQATIQQLQGQLQQLSDEQERRSYQTESFASRTIHDLQLHLEQSRQERGVLAGQVDVLRQGQVQQASTVMGLQGQLESASREVARTVAGLQHGQLEQASTVQGLQAGLERTNRSLSVHTDQYVRSEQTSRTSVRMELEERLLEQERKFAQELSRLQNKMEYLETAKGVSETEIMGLKSALAEERQAVLGMEEYIKAMEISFQPVSIPDVESDAVRGLPLTLDETPHMHLVDDDETTLRRLQRLRMVAPTPPLQYQSQTPPSVHQPRIHAPVPPPVLTTPPSAPILPPPQPTQPTQPVPPIQSSLPMFPAAQMRPREPPAFKGELNEDLDAWFGIVRDYTRLMQTSAEQNVAYMATLLQGAARTYWDSWLRDHPGSFPRSVTEFHALLRARFLSPMHESNARATLWTISQRQQETSHAFSHRFQQLLARLTTYDAQDMMERFIRALRPELRLPVAQQHPKTLQDAIYVAEHLEHLTASYLGKASTSTSTHGQGATATAATTTGGRKDKGRQGGQQGGKGKGQQQKTTSQSQGSQQKGKKRFPPCPICKRTGHSADFCWDNPNSPHYRGGRAQGQQSRGQTAGKGQARSAALVTVNAGSESQQQGHQHSQHHPTQGNAGGLE